ncbi:hypothetical protein VF04_04280 [Nostoc linckia z7]|uniref:Uncharacterized protein n=2 Tax=Nostoc linckia TaxID=92942 RepID=A0A9Q5ZGH7_NOSLI|nr:hypothetical protein [Nostoc linckia]PHK42930.1 hypothetical protein VF12_00980 [Nostoc linckia z15]PHK48087.1 hypothetical protein VF13_01955 [Nostoc linckia z16]PHJ65007.1 hypothetical protein VF02_11765 [Nostoc linckia z1]PHJ70185.1 hypothetical protein VF05_11925 [Nostoc linckia z3]PHJ75086.1 hypothetical protein VF03_12085 [Nostoc linckia z2]
MNQDINFVEQITQEKFDFYEQAIAKYGQDVLHIQIAAKPKFRPLPCSLEEDMVTPLVPQIRTCQLRLRLAQITKGRNCWWQYINEGEI